MTLFIYILLVIILTYYGNKKGHGTDTFVISLLFSPLAGMIALSLFSDKTVKTCPQCAEKVKTDAKTCRFCQYDFSK